MSGFPVASIPSLDWKSRRAALVRGPINPSMGPGSWPLSFSACWTAITCGEPWSPAAAFPAEPVSPPLDPDGVDADPDESVADVDPDPASGLAASCVAPEPELGAEVDGDADGALGAEVEDDPDGALGVEVDGDPDGALGVEVDGDDDGELGVVEVAPGEVEVAPGEVEVAPGEGELGVDADGDDGELGVEVEGDVEADGDLSPGRAPV